MIQKKKQLTSESELLLIVTLKQIKFSPDSDCFVSQCRIARSLEVVRSTLELLSFLWQTLDPSLSGFSRLTVSSCSLAPGSQPHLERGVVLWGAKPHQAETLPGWHRGLAICGSPGGPFSSSPPPTPAPHLYL